MTHSKLKESNPTSLPVEVVTHIFSILKPPPDLYDRRDTIHSQEKYTLDTRAIGQVCYQWHAIALGCPALWTYVAPVPLGYQRTKEMLDWTTSSRACVLGWSINFSANSCM
jgi:hypothetical protein